MATYAELKQQRQTDIGAGTQGAENDTTLFGLVSISHSAFNVIFVVVDPPVADAYADPLWTGTLFCPFKFGKTKVDDPELPP